MSPPMGNVKLKFYGCSFGNPSQLGIGGMFVDHHETLVKLFSKNVGSGSNDRGKDTTLIRRAKAKSLSNLLVEGDFAVILIRVNKKERSL